MTDKTYWENYYAQQNQPFQPSEFAVDCVRDHLKSGMTLLELGCGNGRDAIFMANHGLSVIAVDQCQQEIDFLNQFAVRHNLFFDRQDFSRLPYNGKFDAIYSRFTLHAITHPQEMRTLKWSAQHLKYGGFLLIEARGTQNEYFGRGKKVAGERNAFIYEGHYRRFLDKKETVKQIEKNGMTVVSADERNGRAPFNGTDYKFLRIIAQKTR